MMVSPRKRPNTSIVAGWRVATELSSALDSSTINRLGLHIHFEDESAYIARQRTMRQPVDRGISRVPRDDCTTSINRPLSIFNDSPLLRSQNSSSGVISIGVGYRLSSRWLRERGVGHDARVRACRGGMIRWVKLK